MGEHQPGDHVMLDNVRQLARVVLVRSPSRAQWVRDDVAKGT